MVLEQYVSTAIEATSATVEDNPRIPIVIGLAHNIVGRLVRFFFMGDSLFYQQCIFASALTRCASGATASKATEYTVLPLWSHGIHAPRSGFCVV